MRTLVVNLFAGPGGGKTTCAWDIASKLKQRGIEAEYVSEYAKELVWDGKTEMLDGSLENQKKLYEEQNRRVQRLLGKVDVVVTDSPAILSAIYAKETDEEFIKQMLSDFNNQKNFNLFINRGKTFQQQGRIHTLEESKKIDKEIKKFLVDNNIYFGNYYHKTLNVVVDNIILNLGGK